MGYFLQVKQLFNSDKVSRIPHMSLESLAWQSNFIEGTPGDSEVGGHPRQVPGACWSRVDPTPTPNPKLRLWSREMANVLGIDGGESDILGGCRVASGMAPYAQRYGGYQFGNWAGQLGDGRAITLGEANVDGQTYDLQLKGSGLTPYSRFADGKAVLRSSIREFLCSEAMLHLGVPTTRALSLVTTGEQVVRDIMYDGNPEPEPGAIVCRVAESFLRFGSFEIHSAMGDYETLRNLVDFTILNHFEGYDQSSDEGLVRWLNKVAEDTAAMIAHWERVGFVHGVMNTDNMSIHGITIDYGPFGWIEDYDLNWTPNTTDSNTKRYTFGNQRLVGEWNLARLLEAIGPLFEDPSNLYRTLEHYRASFKNHNEDMWRRKLGLGSPSPGDNQLVEELSSLLELVETDMTIFFRLLSALDGPSAHEMAYAYYDDASLPVDELEEWLGKWWSRVDGNPDREAMNDANPKYVLRNWMSQLAIEAAENDDYSVAIELQSLLRAPYDEQPSFQDRWYRKRPEWARSKVGCSMLSCSS